MIKFSWFPGVICTDGNPWRTWLEVDGDRLPGSAVKSLPSGVEQRISLSGISADSVPAGDHEVTVAIECVTGDFDFAGSTFGILDQAKVVVLGG